MLVQKVMQVAILDQLVRKVLREMLTDTQVVKALVDILEVRVGWDLLVVKV